MARLVYVPLCPLPNCATQLRPVYGPPHSQLRQSEESTQKINRAWSWNILGGSIFANAGIAFVAVPAATN